MKNQKGVSLFEVVIAIIILLIIACFAIFNSRDSAPKAKAAELYSEMKSVEAAIDYVRMEMATREDFELIVNEHYDELAAGNLYRINSNGLAADFLGIKGLKRDYLIDYDTGHFELVQGVNIKGITVTTIDEVKSFLNSNNL